MEIRTVLNHAKKNYVEWQRVVEVKDGIATGCHDGIWLSAQCLLLDGTYKAKDVFLWLATWISPEKINERTALESVPPASEPIPVISGKAVSILIDCRAVHAVAHAMSVKTDRPCLNGFHIALNGDVVATDGYRMAIHKNGIKGSLDTELNIPSGVVKHLPKKGMTKCQAGDGVVSFPDIGVVVKLIDKKYPDYLAAIPACSGAFWKMPTEVIKKAMNTAKDVNPHWYPLIWFAPDGVFLGFAENNTPIKLADSSDFPGQRRKHQNGFRLPYLIDAMRVCSNGSLSQPDSNGPLRIDHGDLTLVIQMCVFN